MTTHTVSQIPDLHQPRQRTAGKLAQTCEASLCQMSEAPIHRWTYIPDGRYTNSRTYPYDEDRQRQKTTLSSYPSQEHPRFVQPLTQNHELTMMQTANPGLQWHGRAWDKRNDPNYRYPAATPGSLEQYSIQRQNAARKVEYRDQASSYYDASRRSRSSVGSVGRRDDVDSQ